MLGTVPRKKQSPKPAFPAAGGIEWRTTMPARRSRSANERSAAEQRLRHAADTGLSGAGTSGPDLANGDAPTRPAAGAAFGRSPGSIGMAGQRRRTGLQKIYFISIC